MNGRSLTVILANGDFPRPGGKAWRLLTSARRVVGCDGAADAYRRRFRRWPEVVVGDLDSLRLPGRKRATAEVVRVDEQETNDLAKAIRLCRERGWRKLVILGATGKREDHTLGNVFRALADGIEIVTDYGRFVPVSGRRSLRVRRGAAVSIFAPDPQTRMTSTGLEWPLDDMKFGSLYCATLNRAEAARVTLTASRPVSVFLAEAEEQR